MKKRDIIRLNPCGGHGIWYPITKQVVLECPPGASSLMRRTDLLAVYIFIKFRVRLLTKDFTARPL